MEIQRRWRESQVFFLVLELLFLAAITHLYAWNVVSVRPSVRPSVYPVLFLNDEIRQTNTAVFEGKKSSNEIVINDTMSDDEVVASDVLPRYLFSCFSSESGDFLRKLRIWSTAKMGG